MTCNDKSCENKWMSITIIGFILAITLGISIEEYIKYLSLEIAMKNGYEQQGPSKIWVKKSATVEQN